MTLQNDFNTQKDWVYMLSVCVSITNSLWQSLEGHRVGVLIIPALNILSWITCEETQTRGWNGFPWVMLLAGGWAWEPGLSELLGDFHSVFNITAFLGLIWFYQDGEVLRGTSLMRRMGDSESWLGSGFSHWRMGNHIPRLHYVSMPRV